MIGTEPNQIAPGKRMLSSMTPTLVVKDGKVVLITGSPGGRTIINTVLNMVVNVVDFDMSVRDAVDSPRMHHQWFPDRIQAEAKLWSEHPKAIAALEKLGHTVTKVRAQGDAQADVDDGGAEDVGEGLDAVLGIRFERVSVVNRFADVAERRIHCVRERVNDWRLLFADDHDG